MRHHHHAITAIALARQEEALGRLRDVTKRDTAIVP